MTNQEAEQLTQQEIQIINNNQPYCIFIENKTDKIIENIKLFDIDNVLKNGKFNDKKNLIENGVEINMGFLELDYSEFFCQFLYQPFVCKLFFLCFTEIESFNSINSVIIQKINNQNIYDDLEIQSKKMDLFQLKFNNEFYVDKKIKIIIPKILAHSKIQCVFYLTKIIN
jgi:hypothetical protein